MSRTISLFALLCCLLASDVAHAVKAPQVTKVEPENHDSRAVAEAWKKKELIGHTLVIHGWNLEGGPCTVTDAEEGEPVKFATKAQCESMSDDKVSNCSSSIPGMCHPFCRVEIKLANPVPRQALKLTCAFGDFSLPFTVAAD